MGSRSPFEPQYDARRGPRSRAPVSAVPRPAAVRIRTTVCAPVTIFLTFLSRGRVRDAPVIHLTRLGHTGADSRTPARVRSRNVTRTCARGIYAEDAHTTHAIDRSRGIDERPREDECPST